MGHMKQLSGNLSMELDQEAFEFIRNNVSEFHIKCRDEDFDVISFHYKDGCFSDEEIMGRIIKAARGVRYWEMIRGNVEETGVRYIYWNGRGFGKGTSLVVSVTSIAYTIEKDDEYVENEY